MRSIRRLVFIIILFMGGAPGACPESDPDPAGRELSIEEVSRLALENSFDVQIAKFDAYIKRTAQDYEESIFDAFICAAADYEKDRLRPASSLAGSETIKKTYSLEVEKKLPTGTTLTVSGETIESKSDSIFTSLNPSYEAVAGVSLVQELGKNFFGLADRGAIKITQIDIENAEYTSLSDIEKVLYQAQAAYWKLVLREKELSVAEDILQQAERLYDVYSKKYDIGLVEEADLLAAQVSVRLREGEVYEARLEKETAKNELLFLLNESDTGLPLQAADTLEITPYPVDLYPCLQAAVENRRDYIKVKNELRAQDIDIVIKENALWPEIDLAATYKKNGLASGLRRAWEDAGNKGDSEVFVGVSLKIPFQNRKAKAQLASVRLKKEQLLLALKRVERLILKEINNRVKEVNILHNEVNLLAKVAQLQEEKLAAETKRLKYGRSSSDLIIRYTEDLLKARLAYAGALYRYRLSLIGLELDKNVLLSKYWRERL